jgi:hypothetical protein
MVTVVKPTSVLVSRAVSSQPIVVFVAVVFDE